MERLYPALFAVIVACAAGGVYLFNESRKAAPATAEAMPAASVRSAVKPLESKVCVMRGGQRDC